ncbi:hypothetical protein RHGRI_016304 [Rhododendron griersonianum]|uniref:Non-specific serine/threonine protein kinase n=1 Tax=Rhododendron griersonianum TaxID=479676 RepID=A0AAV6JTN4_9ERIC|nr:hypothetical protein RHGRI_016304 [Rhododendron griersonianum]
MDTPILVLIISLLLSSLPPLFSISSLNDTLPTSSSLSVSDFLISENGIFSAGFYSVGENAYCFSIWFTESTSDGNLTVVWMANRDQPVNGRRSKLSLLKSGNLKLTDAAQFLVWSTNTKSISPLNLQLLNTGNLVLQNQNASMKVWESFDSPTDTLLPNQTISRNSKLVSSRSHKNFSSGFYALFFDYDNVLRLLFDGAEASSLYWPDPGLVSWEAGRSTYNNSPTAAFNSSGYFRSSDDFKFKASDYGIGVWRRLRMDVDGNVRLYSLDEEKRIWRVSWQAISQPCKIHGVCGPNAMCNYHHLGENAGRRCSCLPGYEAKNLTDWSFGCEPEFNLSCNAAESGFIELPHTEFYGYDFKFCRNCTYARCEEVCLESCKCYGFNFRFNDDSGSGYYNCYPKSLLLNGYRSPSFGDPFYLRLPKASVTFNATRKQEIGLHCPPTTQNLTLDRGYKKPKENRMLQFMVWFASAFGGFEIICICFVWLLLYKTQQRSSENTQSYLQVVSGFRKFTYAELKKATRNFREEIGRGGSGIVYKGRGLVKWVREKMNGNGENELWLEEIIDPVMKGKCDLRKMGILVQVALECVKEDKDARPTMSQKQRPQRFISLYIFATTIPRKRTNPHTAPTIPATTIVYTLTMDTPIPIVLISLLLSSLPLFSISSPHDTLPTSSSLFVSDVLISPNGIFSASFHSVGENAYCFSMWFTEPTSDGNLTAVWMSNRDQPVNGKRSKLSLLKSGNLILTDAAQFTVWSTNTKSISSLQLQLNSQSGYFRSSGDFEFKASDYGIGAWRILKMDVDGNVRLYSLDEGKRIWSVSWQAMSQPCKIHGVCGPNAMCNYDYPEENAGQRCSCLPG